MKFQIPPWSNQHGGIHVPILYGPTCNLTFWRPIKYLDYYFLISDWGHDKMKAKL
jgi:hypothetical protein